MALAFDHGAIQALAADAVSTVYTVSGLSFQPKALRFYWVGLKSTTDAASQAVHSRRGVGFATSTSDRGCVAAQSQDAALAMVCTDFVFSDCVVGTVTSTPAIDGQIDLNSITSDGFTLIVDDQLPVDLTIFWEAWGGSDITHAKLTGTITDKVASGALNINHNLGSGNTPSVIMFAGTNYAASGVPERQDGCLMVGFATGTTDAENIVVLGNNDDGSAAADCDGYGRAGDCLAYITTAGGNPRQRAKVTNFAPNGTQFELTYTVSAVANSLCIGMAIRGGNWKADSYTINGNTGSATATVSGLAFTPIGMSLIGRMAAQDAAGTATAQDRIGLGSGSSTTSRRSMGVLDEDGTAACEIDTIIEYDQVLAFPSVTGTQQAAYDISQMNADGFQIIVDTAGGVASEWQGYLTFGNIPSTATDYPWPLKFFRKRHTRSQQQRLM